MRVRGTSWKSNVANINVVGHEKKEDDSHDDDEDDEDDDNSNDEGDPPRLGMPPDGLVIRD